MQRLARSFQEDILSSGAKLDDLIKAQQDVLRNQMHNAKQEIYQSLEESFSQKLTACEETSNRCSHDVEQLATQQASFQNRLIKVEGRMKLLSNLSLSVWTVGTREQKDSERNRRLDCPIGSEVVCDADIRA